MRDLLSFAVGIGRGQLGVEQELFGIAVLAVGSAFEGVSSCSSQSTSRRVSPRISLRTWRRFSPTSSVDGLAFEVFNLVFYDYVVIKEIAGDALGFVLIDRAFDDDVLGDADDTAAFHRPSV